MSPPKRRFVRSLISADELRRLYWEEELPTRKIAQKLNIGHSSIRYIMQKYNIPFRKLHNRPIGTPKERILAYLAGVLAGDGHLGSNYFTLQVIDKDFARHTYIALKSFSEPTFRTNFRRDKNKYLYSATLSRRTFVPVIKAVKFSKLSKPAMISFINGFIDSEGCILDNERHGRCGGRISISNNNTKLLKEISIFMTAINIPNRIHKTHTTYEIMIWRLTALRNFNKVFHLSIGRKRNLLKRILSRHKFTKMDK